MINRRLMLGTALAAGTLVLAGAAGAQDWKSKYPELVFAVVPAENASGVTERDTSTTSRYRIPAPASNRRTDSTVRSRPSSVPRIFVAATASTN